ncbi:putative transcriptional acitvator, Baf family [Deinococcus proteolyticus MRP]|uniref:Type III pantothenate kinase n=1 Tax=Deinococcus proteolyticus (strain ATCC 35074 / DSM 20540 / JCM 6276 / NBRC 101906 / NCIMB 13154 / VKM Ac-1939 / CCM 2703 / MRP) TaxID=693977 RepID=F0RJ55_DEIPM|nr:putative transcriptional acitvator, Baf family [Deinococcus proteolyticus MRP]
MRPVTSAHAASPAHAAQPLLVIDIGNTSTVLGLTDGCRALVDTWRVRTNRDLLPDDLARQVRSLFAMSGRELPAQAVLSSVAPPVGENYVQALERRFGMRTFSVSSAALPQVSVELDDPAGVGADRLCNLFGAQPYLERENAEYAVVVDFGTSTNFDVIGRGHRFLGGILATGAQVSADALFARAAKLPRIALQAPPRTIGKNTVQALQAGLVFGYAEMVDGLLRRTRAELDAPAITIATGGFASVLQGICTEVDFYDEGLTLRGLIELWEQRERGQGQP